MGKYTYEKTGISPDCFFCQAVVFKEISTEVKISLKS